MWISFCYNLIQSRIYFGLVCNANIVCLNNIHGFIYTYISLINNLWRRCRQLLLRKRRKLNCFFPELRKRFVSVLFPQENETGEGWNYFLWVIFFFIWYTNIIFFLSKYRAEILAWVFTSGWQKAGLTLVSRLFPRQAEKESCQHVRWSWVWNMTRRGLGREQESSVGFFFTGKKMGWSFWYFFFFNVARNFCME